jgi:hypothetical protein
MRLLKERSEMYDIYSNDTLPSNTDSPMTFTVAFACKKVYIKPVTRPP